jgi:uncharacterized protein DUF5317
MNLVLSTIVVAVVAGYLAGGRLSGLGTIRVRWSPLALIGLVLQLLPVPGRTWPLVLLLLSFAMLLAFAAANIRAPGFVRILLGMLLNLTVIAVNQGMPVTREALEKSGQGQTLQLLIQEGGAKHHLATERDRLSFLGDVIPIAPIQQAVSIGDVLAYTGVGWFVVAGMRRRCVGTREAQGGVEVQHVES